MFLFQQITFACMKQMLFSPIDMQTCLDRNSICIVRDLHFDVCSLFISMYHKLRRSTHFKKFKHAICTAVLNRIGIIIKMRVPLIEYCNLLNTHSTNL